jgi:hypothetical protein
MSMRSQYPSLHKGAQASQTSYTNAVPRRKAVGSGASAHPPKQQIQSQASAISATLDQINLAITQPLKATGDPSQRQHQSESSGSIHSHSSVIGQSTDGANNPAASFTPNEQNPPSSPTPTTPSPSKEATKPLVQPFQSHRRDANLLFMSILASVCFAVTAWFAKATFSGTALTRTRNFFQSTFRVDIGNTLTILTILSRLLTLVTGLVLDRILEVLHWSLICRDQGASISTVLAISGTTGWLGALGIMCRKGPELVARLWAAIK